MKYYKFWHVRPAACTRDGHEFFVRVHGVSNLSASEAERDAMVQEEALLESIRDETYETDESVLREEVVKEVDTSNNPVVITRNRYGSLVLNTSDVIMTDHDFQPGVSWLRSFLSFFFPSLRKPATKSEFLDLLEARLRQFQLTARIYETRKGFRCILTNRRITGGNPESLALLRLLGCDPAYTQMTGVQQCYRARLTPKPWRVKMSKPPVLFPYESQKIREVMEEWVALYDAQCRGFSTCRFIVEVGEHPNPGLATIVALHDELTQAFADNPLA